MAQKIKFKRGTAADLLTITPEDGEPCWASDAKRLVVGDGTTAGGVAVSATIGSASVTSVYASIPPSGALLVEQDGLNRLHLGDGTSGGRVYNNAPIIRYDANTIGRPGADTTYVSHPIYYAPVKDGTAYNLEGHFQLDVGGSPASYTDPTMNIAVEGFATFLGNFTLIQNVSSTQADASPTGVARACELRTTAVTIPGIAPGSFSRSICHIYGAGVTHAAGTVFPTGRGAVGLRFSKSDITSLTVRVRAGGYLSVSEIPLMPSDVRMQTITSGSTASSGSNIFARCVAIGFPPPLITYFWRANGNNITAGSGSLAATGQTPPFQITGYPSGTLWTCLFSAANDYATGIGETNPCRQI